jgi:hypothetical protein
MADLDAEALDRVDLAMAGQNRCPMSVTVEVKWEMRV